MEKSSGKKTLIEKAAAVIAAASLSISGCVNDPEKIAAEKALKLEEMVKSCYSAVLSAIGDCVSGGIPRENCNIKRESLPDGTYTDFWARSSTYGLSLLDSSYPNVYSGRVHAHLNYKQDPKGKMVNSACDNLDWERVDYGDDRYSGARVNVNSVNPDIEDKTSIYGESVSGVYWGGGFELTLTNGNSITSKEGATQPIRFNRAQTTYQAVKSIIRSQQTVNEAISEAERKLAAFKKE